jgi:nucleotide-binding universal stress UspA family protein
MKRILVPTDFSKTAEHALKVAAQIARLNNSEIILLHMLDLPQQEADAVVAGSSIPQIMHFKDKVIERLDALMGADYLTGITVSKIVQFEKAFDGILKISKKNNVDFIVMGSNGTSGLHEMFIGSNTEKVIRSAEVPVLVIKNGVNDLKMANFIFASDFSHQFREPFLRLMEFAGKFNAHIHLVTINTPNHFQSTGIAERLMEDFVSGFDKRSYSMHIYNDTSVEKGILRFAKSINADIIAMCTHGRTGLSHFLNGSISENLANHAYPPVLTLKI